MARPPIYGVDTKVGSPYTYDPVTFLRDTRPMSVRIAIAMRNPMAAGCSLLGISCFCLVYPALTNIVLLIGLLFWWWFVRKPYKLPLRLPAQSNAKDANDPSPGKGGKAAGIMYVGTEQTDTEELWMTNSDLRTHFLILGTTGSGKTEALVSLAANALTWGSGFLYTDGKGDSSLWGKIYSLARKFGRDDDVLVLNFMTGNKDGNAGSNTTNPFTTGSPSSLTEMLVSLMDDPGKEGDMWKGRAMGLIHTIMLALVNMRDNGKILLDVNAIREHLNLNKIIELYLDRHGQFNLPQRTREELKAYLDSLPGFDWNEARAGRPQSSTTNDQHGYLQMQFTRIMSSLAGTYGYIFGTELGDVDLYDVVVNRRILAVLLPALEKSEDELANLGKIVVAQLKGMMATTLGAEISGEWGEVIDTKPTNSPTPFIAILDEVGYYTVPGMAVMAAQARSLGFSLIFAAQDVSAMKKRSEKEAESIIANTNFKLFMKLEDPDHTKELFKKSAGGMIVTETAGMSTNANSTFLNYYDMMNASVRGRDKADFTFLKGLAAGQGYLLNSGNMYRTNLFYADPPKAKNLRYNKMVPVRSPDLSTMGVAAIDSVISRLRDPTFRASEAEAARPTIGEVEIATRLMAGAGAMPAPVRAMAAVAAVNEALGGEDIYSSSPLREPVDAGPRLPSAEELERAIGLEPIAPAAAPRVAASSGAGIDEDLFSRLWGSVSNDVINGIRGLQAAATGSPFDAPENDSAVRELGAAARISIEYPEPPPPPRQLEDALLTAIHGLSHALRSDSFAGRGDGFDDDFDDGDEDDMFLTGFEDGDGDRPPA